MQSTSALYHQYPVLALTKRISLPRVPITCHALLEDFVWGISEQSNSNRLPGLRGAITQYTDRMKGTTGYEDFNFYTDLLPHIFQWATEEFKEGPKYCKIQLQGESAVEKLTQSEIRHILANAFLLNPPKLQSYNNTTKKFEMKEGKVGTLSFLNIYSNIDIGIERTMCFIGYFHIQALEKGIHDHRQVTIERCVYLNDHPWNLSDVPIHRSTINILRGRMEDSMAPGFVDFANKRIHIHSIISSCTQEEVLFSCAPEAFLAMAICETLQDGEVVLVRNARRYTDYTGYLDTFRYNGFYGGDTVPSPPPRLLDILVLDAVYRDHFSIHNTTRDMSKAFIAFKAMRGIPIVTGHWGCGIFGGNKVHKFLQQLCAASEAACERLDYSVFHDEELAALLERLLTRICERGWSVGEVYRNLLRIDRREGVSDSVQFEQRIAAFMATEQ